MATKTSLEESYLALVEFLLLAKHRLIDLGSHYGMSGMQTISLLLLDEPRPMHGFKTVFNCDASNVTGIVDALEQKKFVARFESPADRRLKMVKLLAKGRQVRTDILHQLTTDEGYLLAKLSPAEATTFIRLVQKITKA